MTTIAVIPARLDSRRLPRKVLADVGGRPLLWYAWNQVRQAGRIERVVVLTDSKEIQATVQDWGGEVLMTDAKCSSGTHRIASALDRLNGELIINVQADEPLVDPALLDKLVIALQESDADVVTPVYSIQHVDELKNPNIVKVARAADGRPLYFSRSPIPHVRDMPESEWLDQHSFWGHVGVYGYRRHVLETFDSLPDSACESAERLEQLRLLEAGFSIHTVETTYHGINVDTPEDLAKLRRHLEPCMPSDASSTPPRGVILFNRGTKCLVRMVVCLHSLRKWWNGPVTAYLEGSHPSAFERMLRDMNVQIVYSSNPEAGAFIRKVEVCCDSSYDRTLWLDSDTIVCGPIDEVFDKLDEHEVVIPHFANWWSNGRMLRKRIERYRGKCPDEWLDEALEQHPAINVGVFAFRRGAEFLKPWLELSRKGDHREVFLPEEIAFQILYPSYDVGIIDPKFGVSVKHDPGTKDIRIIHYHGQKHVHDFPLCDEWKKTFDELRDAHASQLDELLYLADRRLKRHIGISTDVTIVTACDPQYVEKLRITFPNWVRFKRVDLYPMIVFVHGMETTDSRLDFVRLPNVRLIAWDIDADNQRERMLNAFVAGAAQHVETKWWMKLDADAFATDETSLVTEEMKQYTIYGHRWGRSRAEHIQQLDLWAASHRRFDALPMFDAACVKGDKYLHPRTQSFAQLHSSRFTRYCHKLAGGRMPVPSHDTYMFYVAERLGHEIGRANFKKHHGMDHCSSLRRLRERVPAEPTVDVTHVVQGAFDTLVESTSKIVIASDSASVPEIQKRASTSDLLYFYCGGSRHAVTELLVSLHSFVRSNPNPSFRVGVGLDEESAQWIDVDQAEREWGISCRVLPRSAQPTNGTGDHARHIVNRWRCLPLFSFERAIILDIDTTVNRSLDVLFDDVHPDPDYFTTFARFSNSDRKWDKHVRFYDSAANEYEVNRLYCSIGMHAVHREWPHFERVVKYIDKMAKFKHEHGVRRAYVDEYSVNLISLQNGGKIHYPRQAIRKGRKASTTKREDVPFVWHFILGRTHCNPFWSQALRNAAEDDFLQIRQLL